MNNKTAVTSKSEYQTRACQVCGTEVALGAVPKDSIDDPGHIVVLSSGELTIEEENEGNWDTKSEFSLTRNDDENPNIGANVICESCAMELHNVSKSTETLLSDVPEELRDSKEELSGEIEAPEEVGKVVVVLILTAILLIVIMAAV